MFYKPPYVVQWFGLWCLAQLLTIVQLYYGGHFWGGGETGVSEENHRPVHGIQTRNFSNDRQ